MRFTSKVFKRRSTHRRHKSKFRANNTRRRRLFRKNRYRHMGGGNTLDRSIPLGSVLANPQVDDSFKKENVSIV